MEAALERYPLWSTIKPRGRVELKSREIETVGQRVHFRLFETPCCHYQLYWVSIPDGRIGLGALPNFCPECGKQIYNRSDLPFGWLVDAVRIEDTHATLTFVAPRK